MRPGCRELRDTWIEFARTSALDRELAAHLATCEECTRFVANARRTARALVELARQDVPEELAGRVVAACHSGFLQERAARWTRELARLEAPSALDQKVLGVARADVRAPAVLERLVAEELRDPAKAISRRYVGSLQRQRAPRTLAEHVAHALHRPRPTLRGLRAWQLVAASCAGVLFVVIFGALRADDTRAAPSLAFQHIERVQRAADLGPMAAGMFGSLSGAIDMPARAVDGSGAPGQAIEGATPR